MDLPLTEAPSPIGIDWHESMVPLLYALTDEERTALDLVYLAQAGHGIDLGRPANRSLAIRWWSEFLPGRVVVAARTCSTVGEFMAALCRRLQGQVGGKGEEGERHRAVYVRLCVLDEVGQRQVLDVLERQAVPLVTLVRAELDARRKERAGGKKENDGPDRSGSGSEPGRADTGDLFAGVRAGEPGAGEG